MHRGQILKKKNEEDSFSILLILAAEARIRGIRMTVIVVIVIVVVVVGGGRDVMWGEVGCGFAECDDFQLFNDEVARGTKRFVGESTTSLTSTAKEGVVQLKSLTASAT